MPEVITYLRDFWQGVNAPAAAILKDMSRLGTEGWGGIVTFVAALGVSSPALLGIADTRIPRLLWIGFFLLFGVGIFSSVAIKTRLRFIGYSVGVVSVWVLVLTAETGLIFILLVLTAALSVYIVPLWCGLLLVVLNTVVVWIAHAQQGQALFEVVMMAGFYLLIQLATVFSTATLVREQQLRAQLVAAHVDLQAASVFASESARTAERLRISRDLHDLIGHQLTALTLQLETARHVDSATARQHIDSADTVARELLRDVRATVTQLRVQAPDLEEVLRQIGDGIPGLAVAVHVAENVRADEHVSAAFLRATQEVVTNTIRHANAQKIWVEITSDSLHTTFVARDDGQGTMNPALGNGLQGLQERFGELGGILEVNGSDGFCVTAKVPHS